MYRLANWQLFGICVLAWSTTWYAITVQVGQAAPDVAVAFRFLLAGTLVLASCLFRRERLRLSAAEHGWVALQGGFMFGVSYLCVYHAEQHLASGLVAVGYSASPLVAGLGGHRLFGIRVTRRFVLGGLVGLAGIAVIYRPEIGRAGAAILPGLSFLAAAVLLSAVGGLIAIRNRAHGLPFWSSLGFAMLYGAAVCALTAVLHGRSFVPPASPAWWLSLLYLALVGSVLAFAGFLTLQHRIGPGPTGAIGVMTPLLALVVSAAFEGFRPDAFTYVGAALAVAGNVMMLFRRAAG